MAKHGKSFYLLSEVIAGGPAHNNRSENANVSLFASPHSVRRHRVRWTIGTNFNHQPLIEFALGSGLNSKANIKLPATAEQSQMLTAGKGAQAKQRSKCKDGQSKQRKLSKRKRRRRRDLHEDTAPRPAIDEQQPRSGSVEPVEWTADKRNAFKETLHHDVHANDGRVMNEARDPEQGAHVRHAMLWIKVNVNENMSKKHMKWAKRQKPKLWLFQITGQPASVVSSIAELFACVSVAHSSIPLFALAYRPERCEAKQGNSQQEPESVPFGVAEIGHHLDGAPVVRARQQDAAPVLGRLFRLHGPHSHPSLR